MKAGFLKPLGHPAARRGISLRKRNPAHAAITRCTDFRQRAQVRQHPIRVDIDHQRSQYDDSNSDYIRITTWPVVASALGGN
jgi:hypothetical protein